MSQLQPARVVSAGTFVISPRTDVEWSCAQILVHQLLDWIVDSMNVDPMDVQEGIQEEFRDFRGFYSPPRGQFYVGILGGRIVGTTGVRMMDAETAELKRVWVNPSGRGSGLAPLMLEEALQGAQRLGATRIRLETVPAIMGKAVQIYKENGFVAVRPYSALSESVEGILAMERILAA